MPAGASTIPITNLKAPATSAHMKQFTLTAENATVSFGSGINIPSWTFNGVEPGPTLRVQQGDLVVVNVVNHLSFGITIHWHGINIVNSADGVAGVTQDAIKPGQTYVYRFVTNDPGTYWYHSHQLADEETTGGLFGMLIVDPKTPTIHADVDYSVALHEWNTDNNQTVFTLNNTAQTLNEAARPGQWVRLRIAETSNTASTAPHLVTLLGAPFKVVSLDGHDLNAPQWLHETPLPIGTAQRYDLLFQMPAQGSVSLVTAEEKDNLHYQRYPSIVIGQGSVPAQLPPVTSWFDMTTYGQPAHSAITAQSHFDTSYSIALNNMMGTSLGRTGMTYTMNGKVFPNTGMIMVKEGQLVRIHLDNQSALYHPMHLHGHTFTVIAHNGQPLKGSPVYLDTVLVPPHSSYDIAFVANNPGIWMIHCHNFVHANWGMDMMLMYDNYSTPFNVGTQSGNFPD
ncbi:copper oxidase [Dictyobacter formicarum]|uniref:Copper oxidase n=2 Tax=Dictyobacter formicarum TaxID=2778368 RepID=A0ABQ3VVF7_9CHLR|nr:copper oxidase [Dictyobacter formicarum]